MIRCCVGSWVGLDVIIAAVAPLSTIQHVFGLIPNPFLLAPLRLSLRRLRIIPSYCVVYVSCHANGVLRVACTQTERGESRMDVIDTEIGYLGFHDSESYGLVWKVNEHNWRAAVSNCCISSVPTTPYTVMCVGVIIDRSSSFSRTARRATCHVLAQFVCVQDVSCSSFTQKYSTV